MAEKSALQQYNDLMNARKNALDEVGAIASEHPDGMIFGGGVFFRTARKYPWIAAIGICGVAALGMVTIGAVRGVFVQAPLAKSVDPFTSFGHTLSSTVVNVVNPTVASIEYRNRVREASYLQERTSPNSSGYTSVSFTPDSARSSGLTQEEIDQLSRLVGK
ncbi:MAG: hypothetical protein LRZ84_14645 [Desertifilum sp.]|nr:hypothetical protein [Desertifilum sp.]